MELILQVETSSYKTLHVKTMTMLWLFKPGKLLTDGCTQNVTVDNAKVILGVGMSIGSVPPNTDINCFRDVWFRNVEFINPLKAIYVKTNSGKDGFGIIDNINYQNITIHSGRSRGGSRGTKDPPFCLDPIDKTLQHST